MLIPNGSSGSSDTFSVPDPDAVQHAVLRDLGGESLKGSGFEHETPDPQFQFDWTRLNQTTGGLR